VTKALLWLSVAAAVVVEAFLINAFWIMGIGGIPPPSGLVVGMLAAAAIAPIAPLCAAVYFARGGRPAIAVVAAWLPPIAIFVFVVSHG
jgi:hypothetical protein